MNYRSAQKYIAFGLLAVGLLLTIMQAGANLQLWLKSAFIHPALPATYRFQAYDKLLHEFIHDGLVDYSKLKKSPLLGQAIDELANVSPDRLQDNKEKLCYWINAYNLLILKTVCDGYPTNNIFKLHRLMSSRKFIIGADLYSTDEILNAKLDPLFKYNPMATFLICGGRQGDPPIQNHAIEPATMDRDAEQALAKFVNNPQNARYDEVSNVFYLSPYFQRYADYYIPDFQSAHELAASYMKVSVPVKMVSLLKTYWKELNWLLNDTALEPQKTQENGKDGK